MAPFAPAGSIGSPGGTHPIAADGDSVHAVYQQAGRIFYKRSFDGGLSWAHPRPLVESGTAQYPCSLELSGKVLHLVWPDARHGTWELFYKRSADAGQTWGPEQRLTPGTDLFRLGTAVWHTNVFVVWGSRRQVNPTRGGTHTWGELYLKRSADGGLTWAPDIRLTRPEATAMRPAVAVSGRFVHVAWFDRRDATREWDWEIYTKRSSDGGLTWGPDLRMSYTPTHTRHPEIVADAHGVVCCLWEDGQVFDGTNHWSGDAALYAAVSRDNGLSWQKPRRLTTINAPNGWATHPKVFAAGSRVHLAWTDAPDGPAHPHAAYYMTSNNGGLTWTPPERLSTPADGNCLVESVGGGSTYAIVVIRKADALSYRRRAL